MPRKDDVFVIAPVVLIALLAGMYVLFPSEPDLAPHAVNVPEEAKQLPSKMDDTRTILFPSGSDLAPHAVNVPKEAKQLPSKMDDSRESAIDHGKVPKPVGLPSKANMKWHLGSETAAAVTGRLMQRLESLANSKSKIAMQNIKASSIGRDSSSTSLPIPIKFVYRGARFTEEGEKAATLLLKYLKTTKLDNVSLTGHADARGSKTYNMELSRKRLEAIASFLVEGGYRGELVLEPEGESQPFTGVDRSKYSTEDLHELDRRVELRLENAVERKP